MYSILPYVIFFCDILFFIFAVRFFIRRYDAHTEQQYQRDWAVTEGTVIDATYQLRNLASNSRTSEQVHSGDMLHTGDYTQECSWYVHFSYQADGQSYTAGDYADYRAANPEKPRDKSFNSAWASVKKNYRAAFRKPEIGDRIPVYYPRKKPRAGTCNDPRDGKRGKFRTHMVFFVIIGFIALFFIEVQIYHCFFA